MLEDKSWLHDFDALLPEKQTEVIDFIQFLKQRQWSENQQASDARQSLIEILASAPGQVGFKSADEVDAHIRRERDAWED